MNNISSIFTFASCATMTGMDARIVYMGSPDFSVPSLEALAERFDLIGVVTQPDRRAGRGRTLKPPPVKVAAEKQNIPLIQPSSLRKDPQAMSQLRAWEPDVIVVVAFGQILRPDVLNLPKYGCVNVHASLLPRWRGVSPINAAVLHGDAQTGVTIMKMDEGIDTGPILSQRVIPISENDTAGTLFNQLAEIGGQLLVEILPKYISGEIKPTPQPKESPTPYTRMLKKSDGELDFNQPAEHLARLVRAYNPWPGAYTTFKNQPLKVHQAHSTPGGKGQPGTHTIIQNLPAIQTTEGTLLLDQVQPAGKKPMSGDAFLLGTRDWESK
ncbi:methionyl-tRNA formyltransferase [Chloroflexota bacterium]